MVFWGVIAITSYAIKSKILKSMQQQKVLYVMLTVIIIIVYLVTTNIFIVFFFDTTMIDICHCVFVQT